jgi:hypothetical protein
MTDPSSTAPTLTLRATTSSIATVIIHVAPGNGVDLGAQDAVENPAWLSKQDRQEFGFYVGLADAPYQAKIRAWDTGHSEWTRSIQFNPAALRITGGNEVAPGLIELPSSGDIDLTVVRLRSFAPGERVLVSYLVKGIDQNSQLFALIEQAEAKEEKPVVDTLEFTSDHNLIRNNTNDILKSGERYPTIEWDRAKMVNAPITQTAGEGATSLKVKLTLSVRNC